MWSGGCRIPNASCFEGRNPSAKRSRPRRHRHNSLSTVRCGDLVEEGWKPASRGTLPVLLDTVVQLRRDRVFANDCLRPIVGTLQVAEFSAGAVRAEKARLAEVQRRRAQGPGMAQKREYRGGRRIGTHSTEFVERTLMVK